MMYRVLGQTGERVSMVGVGGFHLSKPDDPQLAIRIVRTALDGGINFLDNSWDYAQGESERRMGKALRNGYREKAFLMTKIDGRTAETAAHQIDTAFVSIPYRCHSTSWTRTMIASNKPCSQ